MFGNLLKEALTVIPSQQGVMYLKATGRETNAAGYDVDAFAPGVLVPKTSVQAVPRRMNEFMGLDFTRNYVNWFAPREVFDLGRDTSGDRMTWNGKTFQVQTATDWHGQDGWIELLCVQVDPNSP